MTSSGAKQIAVAVVQRGEHWLIGRRPPGVPLAGYWEFPGGKVRAEETPAAAACRECWEETGLQVRACELLREVEYHYEHGLLLLHFFRCLPTQPDQEPRAPFAWLTTEEARRLTFPPANEPVLRQIFAGGASEGAEDQSCK